MFVFIICKYLPANLLGQKVNNSKSLQIKEYNKYAFIIPRGHLDFSPSQRFLPEDYKKIRRRKSITYITQTDWSKQIMLFELQPVTILKKTNIHQLQLKLARTNFHFLALDYRLCASFLHYLFLKYIF